MAALILLYSAFIVAYAFADDEKTFGPYDLQVLNVTDCADQKPEQMFFDVKTSIVNETTNLVNAVAKLPQGIGDYFRLNVSVDQWKEDKWVEKVFTFTFDEMCTGLRELIPDTFTALTNHLKIDDKCPVPQGEYKFKDFMVSLTTSMAEARYGTFKAKLTAYNDTETVTGCLMTVFKSSPKKN